MKNKIKKLTEKRNEMLGEPKLEIGCEIENTDKDIVVLNDFYEEATNDDGTRFLKYTKGNTKVFRYINYKILGKPISIVDILLMLGEKCESFVALKKREDGKTFLYYDNKTIENFDLTKGDYIKDQKEEVITKLCELFNIK